jgi:putative thioredoxin
MDMMLGTRPEAAVKDVTTATFEKDVMAASLQGPVIVDFWAPWCGPCKQLGPLLEKAVAATGGKASMVKVNIDTSPEIAQALRIQSIPTVYAFYKGQPIDGFQGALPESQVKEFVARALKQAGGGESPIALALEQVRLALDAGDTPTAQDIYAQVLVADPAQPQARAGLARLLLESGQADAAKQLLAETPADIAKHTEILAALAAIELAAQSADTGEIQDLRTRLAQDENDHQARFDLAMACYGQGQKQVAIDELLDIVRRDRSWNEDGARLQLLKLLEALGFTDPLAIEARRRLSSLLFR